MRPGEVLLLGKMTIPKLKTQSPQWRWQRSQPFQSALLACRVPCWQLPSRLAERERPRRAGGSRGAADVGSCGCCCRQDRTCLRFPRRCGTPVPHRRFPALRGRARGASPAFPRAVGYRRRRSYVSHVGSFASRKMLSKTWTLRTAPTAIFC